MVLVVTDALKVPNWKKLHQHGLATTRVSSPPMLSRVVELQASPLALELGTPRLPLQFKWRMLAWAFDNSTKNFSKLGTVKSFNLSSPVPPCHQFDHGGFHTVPMQPKWLYPQKFSTAQKIASFVSHLHKIWMVWSGAAMKVMAATDASV
ncbi:hypothetical protein HAX54_013007 [Datura stramonium]|uniref:Uncharacterized protein n=1 Tax=Datura stramonium TaxID=4076 RepID=A0ABS8Y3L7_DATST|nr:hypothetical protein [Datura stramonium]